MTRDPDYHRVALEVFAASLGALVALGVWRLVVAVIEVLGW